jgi:hypothetical protein
VQDWDICTNIPVDCWVQVDNFPQLL